MSPTPTPPTPAPLPDDLHGALGGAHPATPEILERMDDAIHAPNSANLEAMLGNVTSPWLTFAWTALTIATLLAVAALAVIVWKSRGGDAKTRYRQDADRRKAAAKVATDGFTFTPADTDTALPPAPVNDEETRP